VKRSVGALFAAIVLLLVVGYLVREDAAELVATQQAVLERGEEPATIDGLPPSAPGVAAEGAGAGGLASPKVVASFQERVPIPEVWAGALRGTVTLHDANGRRLPAPDGYLILALGRGKGRTPIRHGLRAEVQGGKWSMPSEKLVDAQQVLVTRLRVGGERAMVDSPSGWSVLSAEGPLDLRAHLHRRSILRVIDGRSGRDLSGVTLLKTSSRFRTAHPGSDLARRVLQEDLVSPIDLRAMLHATYQDGTKIFAVGAEGHAWTLVEVDFDVGGEYRIALEPGGDLELTISGYAPEDRAELLLRGSSWGGEPFLIDPLDGLGRVLIKGIPGGEVRASVDMKGSRHEVLGRAVAEVHAGSVTSAAIALEPLVKEYVSVRVVASLPKEWELESQSLVLNLGRLPSPGRQFVPTPMARVTSRDAPGRPGFNELAWSFESVRVGRYRLFLSSLFQHWTIEVPTGGCDVEFEIPPPADLSLRLVDSRTKESINPDRVSWGPAPSDADPRHLRRILQDRQTGFYSIRVPAIAVRLTVLDMDYLLADEVVDLSTGITQHTIQLERASVLEVGLRHEKEEVRFHEARPASLEPAPGNQGEVLRSSSGGFPRSFQVSEPGRYILRLPACAGYIQPAPQEVEVLAGQRTVHIVELERTHY